MKYKCLRIIGTSHIAQQSLNEVEEAITKDKPGIIALELDKKRVYGLVHKPKSRVRVSDIKRIGVKGFLFSLIGGWAEKKLGRVVGIEPGAEMLKAIMLAKQNNSIVALIDQDIEITLKRISQTLSWKERFRLVGDVFEGIFFRKRGFKKLGIKEIDLTKVPERILIKKLIAQVKKRYPSLYKVLIAERNVIMAKRLYALMKENPDKTVLAIVGAGHEEGIIQLLKGYSEHRIDL